MKLRDARHLATDLMSKHGLIDQGWTFDWSNRKAALGDCHFGLKRIRLSKVLTEINTEAETMDTILHEIAHALAGAEAGHGPKWRMVARQVGASPRAASDNAVAAPKPWRLACPAGCGFAIGRHRKSSLQGSCPRCSGGVYDAKFHLVWVRAADLVAA